MSSQPLLGSNGQSQRNKEGTLSTIGNYLKLGGLSPGSITYDAICLMVNAEEQEERDELAKNWRDHKVAELNFVGTVGALLAGCLASTSAWPDILPNGRDKPWTIRACWHSGLVFALFAVGISCQQCMRLHRLSAHRDGLKYIRSSLAGRKELDRWHPSRVQVWAWEASLVFLIGSVICAIAGLTALVWIGSVYGPDQEGQNENLKMAITFTVMLGLSTILFLVSLTAMTKPTIKEA